MRLQQMVGNRAVQRLILQPEPAEIHREPKQEQSRLTALATITLARRGNVRGDSRLAGYEGKIELLSFGTSTARPGRSGSREAEPLGINFQKHVDPSSPVLMQAVAEGDPVKAARFEFVRPGDGGKWVTAATFEFTDGFATSYQAGSGGEPVESVSMEFRPTK
jgi:type VI protein secretion system component Hcp